MLVLTVVLLLIVVGVEVVEELTALFQLLVLCRLIIEIIEIANLHIVTFFLFFLLLLLLFLCLLLRSRDIGRFKEQVLINLRNGILLVGGIEEFEIVGEAQSTVDKFEVVVGYDEALESFHLVCHLLVFLHFLQVEVSLVEIEERTHLQHIHSVAYFNIDIEIPYWEVHKVVSCNLVEKLILIQTVVFVCHDKDVDVVALGSECSVGEGRVAVNQEHGSAVPHGAHLHLSAGQDPSFLHSLHIESGKFADRALRILLHNGLHECEEFVAVAQLELAHGLKEHEPCSVGTVRIFLECILAGGDHVAELVSLEILVCVLIERVLDLHSITCLILETRVGDGLHMGVVRIFRD